MGKDTFHVHFGLGRLGCALVAPSLQTKGDPYCLVQRPSKVWKELAEEAAADSSKSVTLTFKVNGEVQTSALKVITSAKDVNASELGQTSMVALTDDKELLELLVKRATSFSSSLGPVLTKVLPPMFEPLEEQSNDDDKPILYACENEHDPVDELDKVLNKKVRSVKCMVDRICIDRKLDIKQHTVESVAEQFEGCMVVLKPLSEKDHVPLGGDVLVPEDTTTAEFLYSRKFSIVNGMHGMLAFMSLREADCKLSDDDEDPHVPLIKPAKTESEKLDTEVHQYASMRYLQLLAQFSVSEIAKAIDAPSGDQQEEAVFQSLLDYGTQIFDRMSSMDDHADRIFEGNRSNCWRVRIKPLWVFSQKRSSGSSSESENGSSVASRFIKFANVDESAATEAIAQLAEYSAQQCDDETKDDYKQTKEKLSGSGAKGGAGSKEDSSKL